MKQTLAAARDAFVASMKRETTGPELTRLIAVLDDLIKWSVARPKSLSFRTDGASSVFGFQLAGSSTMFWSARVTRGDAPTLEIYPPTGRMLSAEVREKVKETLNANSRHATADDRGLRIGFGALKNANARQAILAQLEELTRCEPAATSVPAVASVQAAAAS
jgi:hypothetical protein